MSVIDVESLLNPVSSEAPSGGNLEYEPAFGGLERASQGKAEQQMGETIIEAEEPDWRTVKREAVDLLSRSKDLRLGVCLARALLGTDGLIGYRDGLAVLQGLVGRFWETVHPQLDPDDGHDPTMRVNILVSLCGETEMKRLRETTLVSSRVVGRFSLRDCLAATGKIPSPATGKAPPEGATIDAAFKESAIEDLQATATAVEESLQCVIAIESELMQKVGTKHAADFGPLTGLLKSARQVLAEQLARRGVVVPGAEAASGPAQTGGAGAQSLAAGIRSRDDVLRVLDQICEFFEANEPSSPIPLLLRRAKRLVAKNFIDIVKDVASDGLSQVERLRGGDS